MPKRVARQWVEDEKILPLLDGLDEVAAPHREACVDAINSFRREHGLLHIAVCSRIADYQALGKKLRLRSAVEVQPLTKPQVEDYLDRVGEPLQGLRTALQDDPAFWELLESPLMLWVAMLAYRDVARVATQGESLDLRRHHLFANYVEAMFRRRAGDQLYSPEQSMRWLSYLASTLTRNNQTVFYLENLDFEWLPTRAHQWIARAGLLLISALSSGLIFGLAFGRNSWLTGVLRGGLTVGLILGLSGNLFNIRPVEKAGFRINPSFPIATALRNGLIFGLIGGLIDGLILGLSVGLIFGLIKMFTYEAIAETRATPNQGTRRSVKMAMIAGVISGLIVGLICGLSTGPRAGLGYGLKGGLIGGLLSGGLFATKHVTMRLNLWLSRSAPLRYVAFLDEAKQLLFLRQVGGGYIFVHRLLREYFASLR